MVSDSGKKMQPIRCLQTMLRTIQTGKHTDCSIIPDGIYGQHTMDAVMDFQQTKGLDVTGITDETTWNEIVSEYEHTRINRSHAVSLNIVMKPDACYSSGDQCCNILIAQAVLNVFSMKYGNIPQPNISGTMDEQTQESIISFQKICSLPQTGMIDKETWMHMALQYPLCSEKDSK